MTPKYRFVARCLNCNKPLRRKSKTGYCSKCYEKLRRAEKHDKN